MILFFNKAVLMMRRCAFVLVDECKFFVADHPFVYLIRSQRNQGTIYFKGRYLRNSA